MYEITNSSVNKDVIGDKEASREYYRQIYDCFQPKSKLPELHFTSYPGAPGPKLWTMRADLTEGGLKAYAAEKLIAEVEEDTLVYCAPRQGHAPAAIAAVAEMYNKRVVFFMPAAKKPSDHQAALAARDNVELRFVRIAAMPVLNKYAREFAEARGYRYLPFGLNGTPLVTAGLVALAEETSRLMGREPGAVYCAVSTGTMIRALQIGWPNAKAFGVAVSRNIQEGEKGDAELISSTMPFLKRDKIAKDMPFPTTAAYDAKAWKMFMETEIDNSIFINVGADECIVKDLAKVDIDAIDSYREWGDMRDLT